MNKNVSESETTLFCKRSAHYNINISNIDGKPDWKVLKQFLIKEGHVKKEHVV